MRIRLPRFQNRRWRGTVLIGGLIGLVWLGWWFAPPWPEVRLRFTNTGTFGWWTIAGDGQSLIHQKQDRPEKPGGTWQAYFVEIFDLPSGRLRTKITDPDGLGRFEASPNGKHIVCQARNGSWRIYQLSSGKLIGTIPPIQEPFCEWSPDGRFLALETRDHGVTIIRAETGNIVHKFEYSTPIRFTPTSGELIAVSKTGMVDIWTLEPLRRVDSLELPYPSSGDRNEHTDAPPLPGTVHIRKLGCSFDGQNVVALFNRFEPEGDGLAAVSCISCWDRKSRRRTEVVEGNYDIQHNGDLRISANGRYLSHAGWYQLGTFQQPDWLHWQKRDHNRAHFWDLGDNSRAVPRAYDIDSDGTQSLDPTGNYLLVGRQGYEQIKSTQDLRTIRTFTTQESRVTKPEFEQQGKYVAMAISMEPVSWIPTWVPTFLQELISPKSAIAIHRLSDGKKTRRLAYRDASEFTSDGFIWTHAYLQLSNGNDGMQITLERWSPVAPWPPWWLWLITALGCGWIVLRWRRTPSSNLAPIAALT